MLFGFAVLPLRGVLYTLTAHVPALVGIQILDSVGAGVFGAVSVLMGLGAALSQVVAGGVVYHLGYHAGFLFLAAVGMAAVGILGWFMPETRAPVARRG